MNINYPTPAQLPGLRQLWKAAFGDEDAFLDKFFGIAYAPRRCRCITVGDRIAAVLYWFEVSCADQKFAYLYAIATDPGFRGQGLCTALVEDTKALLTAEGFHGLLLVPENEGLARMYEKMGFSPCTTVSEFTCAAGSRGIELHRVDAEEYARLRRSLLPEGGVLQEGADLALLTSQVEFLAGEHCLAAVSAGEDALHCHELLGGGEYAPGILRATGFETGSFRTPGTDKPFAMVFHLSEDCVSPAYFGLALD